MRIDVYHHCPRYIEELLMSNAALESELSALSSALSSKDSIIASQSDALAAGRAVDDSSSSTAIKTAVDEEDNAIASSISSIVG